MAKVTFVLEDVPTANDPTKVRVSINSVVDRSGDTPFLAKVPATPSMLYGLTFKRLFEEGVIDTLIGFVCRDILNQAGVTPEQQKEIAEFVAKQLGQEQ